MILEKQVKAVSKMFHSEFFYECEKTHIFLVGKTVTDLVTSLYLPR